MMRVVLKPLAYLTISSDAHHKKQMDFYLPIACSSVVSGILFILYINFNINIFESHNELLSSIIGLIQTLPGFYIAALAAVASFNNLALDNQMTSPAMTINHGTSFPVDKLSRRRFLCYMLSYLAFISIIACLSIILVEFLYSFSVVNFPSWLINMGYAVSCLIIFFMIVQILILTFVCLWYLGERIHFNDPI